MGCSQSNLNSPKKSISFKSSYMSSWEDETDDDGHEEEDDLSDIESIE